MNQQKFGMMCRWPDHPSAAEWRMHLPSPAFVRCSASKGCSVRPVRASSPWFGGKENDLWNLRHSASHLVRPQAPTRAGFALRRSPHLS